MAEQPPSPSKSKWPYIVGILFGAIAGAVIFVSLHLRNLNERIRTWVVNELSEKSDSRVELESLKVEAFPTFHVVGENLALHDHGQMDRPPLIRIAKFSFNLGLLGVLRLPRHVAGVYVEDMVITVPPHGQEKPALPRSPSGGKTKSLPKLVLDEIVCKHTQLVILPKKEGKDPLNFEIHDLVLKSVGAGKPFDFHGALTNAKPKGEIVTNGEFGPWSVEEPGDTPVSGQYKFSNADLDPFPGIGGTLSSTGTYKGQLNELEVEGETDTPNFSLDPIQRPVPLHTQFSATVNGTDGDTYLHPVRATLGHSLIVANGSVVRSSGKQGHVIGLDVSAPNAKIEDILLLATKTGKPFLTGALNLETKFLLPPGKTRTLEKLRLEGDFSITNGRWASTEVRNKLESFSRRAEGQPANDEAGSSMSDLRGHFKLDQGTITFSELGFSMPGAAVQLHGTYSLTNENLDFAGELRLKAKVSQTVTGAKSFFLRAIDPLFEKKGAGTLLPITITGSRGSPTVGVSVFHKTIKQKLGGQKEDK
jgi:hypothetical protein